MVSAVGYGRLDFILALTFPRKTPPQRESQSDANGDNEDLEAITHVLAHITEAKDVDQDATVELVTYRDYGRSFILDIKNVENVAARVWTQGVQRTGEWVIIDRSGGVARAEFNVEEHGSNDEEQ
ncbi:hypothetical protein RSOLAG1IB_11370 [Rhizoctonia solani AG-1 IB]|uniref:Uncharacterized protein n=1 Tax=Thanatephorus cucumeris (strain AG1-IB / isolate 7/3/14) TaxID=1108050 RepID=M5C762_THACB|nr:hypothetical protein BN14_09923 [Rhizoctonia solani AG-1 IB]CEL53438.1 hypothetical protein RSOLAG1IB_11370 [Rhizoctonia solani AG-1 IB]